MQPIRCAVQTRSTTSRTAAGWLHCLRMCPKHWPTRLRLPGAALLICVTSTACRICRLSPHRREWMRRSLRAQLMRKPRKYNYANIALCYIRQPFTRDESDINSPKHQRADIEGVLKRKGGHPNGMRMWEATNQGGSCGQ